MVGVFLGLIVAAPSSAAELWRGISAGMTWDEVAKLHPASAEVKHKPGKQIEIDKVEITPECRAESNIYFKNGVVDRVVLKGDGSIRGRCSETVLAALTARHGEALSREQETGSYFVRQGTVYIWHRDEVTLRFKRFTMEGAEGGGGGGGGGLLLSSWELTYTAAPAAANL
jgi:hypothetical protein